ncbi:MAG: deoxyguanosinetriphosphate triphosphohydrolase [Oscillospiraceae bacterium]|nr:deoxyguanosinetriphosphate triphosphohydrolase [Oscillospiraceae bacterium]
MNIREKQEMQEKQMLSPFAALSSQSRGREREEPPCNIRTCYQRDRDRIIHCKAYRRLMNKTQVFLSPKSDHFRTRLTHTQEVSQIARTIARALSLNEDLAEAISLGHDLGHTPFGHAGEAVLDEVCPHGFVHSLQSVRIVEQLEKDGRGLNLTWEVRNGIACHSTASKAAETLEGRVVRYADKIAYLNHDIEDAIRAGVLSERDIPFEISYELGRTKSARITSLILSIVENSGEDIVMAPKIQNAFDSLRKFMFEAVYNNPAAKGEEAKAMEVVRRLYAYYIERTEKLPEEYRRIAREQDSARAVCDYISGMSDRYAIALYEELFVPKCWQ